MNNSQLLSDAYSKDTFLEIINGLMPDIKIDERVIKEPINHFDEIISLGSSKDLDLKIFSVKVHKAFNKRVAITNSAFRLMKITGECNALVAFYADDTSKWRLSLLTAQPVIKEGKIITKISDPKRYSYVLGPNSKLKTPTRQLITKGLTANIEELRQRFAIEVVNNEFYQSISALYDELVGTEQHKGSIQHPEQGKDVYHFAVRLIGRIIFCWFLKEKKSANGLPLVPKDVLSYEAANKQADYYNQTLSPLFFEVLNKQLQHRGDRYIEAPYDKIPYLNGGLFDPRDDHYKYGTKIGKYKPNSIKVPDEWLRRLFGILETYNFTIDENTSYDIELSIDPEMLGRIFENLLNSINPETKERARKETGSFYTPREIVEYMVDESLFHHLHNQTDIDEAKLRALISYDLLDDAKHPLNDGEKNKIIDCLSKVQILDPACGSGAFPIGTLQKIVFILQQVDPDSEKWLAKQTEGGSPEFRRHLQNEMKKKSFDYLRKLGVIRECIYGVDIQPIATEISRLRCFLTLIVEQSTDDDAPNRGIKTLPNLDFKFVTANTLVPLINEKVEGRQSIFEQKDILEGWKDIREVYFSSHNPERENLQTEFVSTQNDILSSIIQGKTNGMSQRTEYISTWKPFSYESSEWFDAKVMLGVKDGFDIVMGNPPYIRIPKDDRKDMYAEACYKVFKPTADIYCLFYELGLDTLKQGGILTYITSNSWMRTKYGKSLRQFFKDYRPKLLVDFGKSQIFNAAIVATNILIVQKEHYAYPPSLVAARYDPEGNVSSLGAYIEEHGYLMADSELDSERGWSITDKVANQQSTALKAKIENNNRPLKEHIININYGIKTGCDKAFIIDNETKERLVAADPKSEEVLKPVLKGRDIQSYRAEWSGLWLIATPPSLGIDINKYPVVRKYLLQFGKDRLEQLGNALEDGRRSRKKTGHKWFELQDSCAYYEEFEKEKIIWGELSDIPKFTLDTEGYFVHNTAFVITGSHLKFILGILNSKLSKWYFDQIATSSGTGTNRWLKYKVEQIPIPEYDDKIGVLLEEKVQLILSNNAVSEDINSIVYRLYGLTPDDVKTIESGVSI